MLKRLIQIKALITLLPTFVIACLILTVLAGVFGAVSSGKSSDCNAETPTVRTASSPVESTNGSIDEFVKKHEDAYIESWRVGGFLPSASIAQSMTEHSYSPNVPSFAQAHNMGGVKWTNRADYIKTIELYGSNAVSNSGPGTVVGDNTGGGYAWFESFDAGIVGKAEFMSRQTLYTGAINNTDGLSTLNAIADGGWATDPNYKATLNKIYQELGSKYKWLDEKAIKKYGKSPVSEVASNSASSPSAEKKSKPKSESKGPKASDWELVLVNRDNKKPEMNPQLSTVGNIQVDSRIEGATKELLAKAQAINPAFHLISGYRSVETQKGLYDGYVQQEMSSRGISYEEAEKFTQEYSQPAGASEHQTGLALDISTVDSLNQMSAADSEALKKVATELGFVRRFEENYKSSTGVGYEDWHYRYVGKENAKKMTERNQSLEEYVKTLDSGDDSEEDGEDGQDDCDEDSGSSSAATDGTGERPADAAAWGYSPDELPDSLKSYIIDPKSLGMEYGTGKGWNQTGINYLDGQCVNLTISLGNILWNHKGSVSGNGIDQAAGWASVFGNNVKKTPKKGAIFSSGQGQPGHTGIVCHVFKDGSILFIEQNTPLSGIDYFGKSFTWNYRIWSPEEQKAENAVFAYPDDQEPKLK